MRPSNVGCWLAIQSLQQRSAAWAIGRAAFGDDGGR